MLYLNHQKRKNLFSRFSYIVVLLAFIFFYTNSLAQGNLEFVENKGQWHSSIVFQGELQTGAFALEKNGYRVLLHNPDDLQSVYKAQHKNPQTGKDVAYFGQSKPTETLRSHAYGVRFLQANPNVKILPEKPLPGYINYFIGDDPKKWASECISYQTITYQEMYKGIDVRYYTNNGQIKYDIIVHPYADPNQVVLYFDGIEKLRVLNRQLVIQTSVQEVREMEPYTYQQNEALGKREIVCQFEVKGNLVKFKLPEGYDQSKTLIIDPSLVFSTFSGSRANNWGFTATYDALGNFYGGGIVASNGFPVNNGAFQTSFQGGQGGQGSATGWDIGIIKLNANGSTRVYATYIGGNGNEQPHSLVVDAFGNLIVAGRSNSSNYPSTGPSFGPGGNFDIILTKLNAQGTGLIGSRRIGGTGIDGMNIVDKTANGARTETTMRNYGDDARSEVIVDAVGNIYLASCTQSNNFPVTGGAAQSTNNSQIGVGRNQDAIVLKTDPNISNLLFSTYFGGRHDDAAFVLALNPGNNDIYVAGGTASNNLPGDKTGTVGSAFQGGETDGFIAIFNNNGALQKVSYIGTASVDIVYGIQFDRLGFPYITGTTTNGNWPVINATFSQNGGKQFIGKLRSDLSGYVYSTRFGPNTNLPNISPTAFLVDRCENVYVSGWGGSILESFPNAGTNGLSVTSDAEIRTTDGNDFYFFVLAKNAANQLYGSFFGQRGGIGEHVDGGTSRFDANGVIYQAMCANCGRSAPFPTTPGVWSPTNQATGNGECNLAAVKIAFNFAGVGSAVQSSINGQVRDTAGCVPLTVVFRDTLEQGRRYIWNFGDGSPSVTTNSPTVSYTYNFVGNYRVSLISIDSSTCNIADTSFLIMRVRSDEAVLSFTQEKLAPCEALRYRFTNTSIAPSGKPFQGTSFRWNFGDGNTRVTGPGPVEHSYATAGTYTVRLVLIDSNYCNEPDSVSLVLRIAPNVTARFETPAQGCVPYRATFNNTSLAGQRFIWDFGNGNTLNTTSAGPVTSNYPIPGTYTIRMIAIDSATCNIIDSTQFTITVRPNPTSNFSVSPIPPEENTITTFTNLSVGGIRYKWLWGDGDSLITTSTNPVTHLYNRSGTFNACLITFNDAGCSDTTCIPVNTIIVPGLAVPNAFSPNGDGVNDKVFVRGFGIAKMMFRIFNRWGEVVFITDNQSVGWDGFHKGKLQPQDVYHYTLDVEFVDGQKIVKKGDITLLR